MKRKRSAALVLVIVLGLALMGTAYAVFSSQVAEFFSRHWNQELGESLQEGKIAQIGESVTIGDVVFTLDEIVYRDRALYGLGTARPLRDGDVIVPFDLGDDPECFQASDEAKALVEKAAISGGRLLVTYSMPRKIGVDDGTLLTPGCVGYYDIANGDGSVTFSFEASDGFAISEGTSYQIQMESCTEQIDPSGAIVEGSRLRADWTVSCMPVFMTEPASQASDRPVTIENRDGYELVTPVQYQETGILPIYQAVETDFSSTVDPVWFNRTGIAAGIGTDEIRFTDHAILNPASEALFYYEFTDDNYTEAPSNIIVDRAWVREWSGHRGEFSLDRTELTGITLSEAQAQAEAMMARLGIDSNDYVCVEALDLSLERIRTMGAIWEQAIVDGELLVDDDYQPYDYASIPATEEGYYLKYFPLGIDTSPAGGRHSVIFYVTSRGIVYAAVRNAFTRGEILSTPEALITPDAAIARLAEVLSRSLSWNDRNIQAIQQAALTYEAVRADNKADGMVFVPVWMILYQDESAVKSDSFCYALINAVDGTLIDASFR
ncbi:MAG: DUF4179 domain-containing protein [Clostridia bacterium]|nr:DUF4179 domain-containing protein [Clostridia bacterium]